MKNSQIFKEGNYILQIIYIDKILDKIICCNNNIYIINCTQLLDYDKIVLCNRIFVLYCTYCVILANFLFSST